MGACGAPQVASRAPGAAGQHRAGASVGRQACDMPSPPGTAIAPHSSRTSGTPVLRPTRSHSATLSPLSRPSVTPIPLPPPTHPLCHPPPQAAPFQVLGEAPRARPPRHWGLRRRRRRRRRWRPPWSSAAGARGVGEGGNALGRPHACGGSMKAAARAASPCTSLCACQRAPANRCMRPARAPRGQGRWHHHPCTTRRLPPFPRLHPPPPPCLRCAAAPHP